MFSFSDQFDSTFIPVSVESNIPQIQNNKSLSFLEDFRQQENGIGLLSDESNYPKTMSTETEEDYDYTDMHFFRFLTWKLWRISIIYHQHLEDLTRLLVKVNGNVCNLVRYLEGEPIPVWSLREDLALIKHEETKEFKSLIKKKAFKKSRREEST